jgi:hypothetical protein
MWDLVPFARACKFVPSCLVAVLLGCSSAQTVRHEHHVQGTITLEADSYRVRGYDPNDARLVRSLDEIEDVLGRRLVVRFHVQMMPREAGFFERFFESELGKLPKRLRLWKKTSPAEFDAMLAELRHVDFDYDGALPAPKSELGPPAERLRITLNSWQLPDELLTRVLHQYRARHLARRYLDVAPRAIPAAERPRYADALLRFGAPHFASIEPHTPENKEPSAGRSEVILRLVELSFLAGNADAKLDAKLTEALIEAGGYFRGVHQNNPEFVRSLREPSRFLRAKREWMRWSLAGLRSLSPEPRDRLVEVLMTARQRSPRMLLDGAVFPGFDLVAFGHELFGAWAKAGHPTGAGDYDPAADPKIRLFDRVLCPTAPNERGFRTRRARHCYAAFYATSVMEPKARAGLLTRASDTADPIVFREIALNLLSLASSHMDFPKTGAIAAVLELWRVLENKPARFRELTRLLAVEINHSYALREALYDQTTRYYRTRAADRGALLFLLARIDGYSRTSVNWKHFAGTYGADITEPELATYLDQSYLAFEEFKNLDPALRGSPGSVLAPKIRQYLDDPAVHHDLRSAPMVLRAIISVLARRKDEAGLLALQVELEHYVGKDPTRERTFRDILEILGGAR